MMTPVPRLTNYPVLQKQPNDYTCVPTCIAMAMDMEVDTVIKHCEDLGIDLTNGMNDTVPRYVLMTLNIASYPFQPVDVDIRKIRSQLGMLRDGETYEDGEDIETIHG